MMGTIYQRGLSNLIYLGEDKKCEAQSAIDVLGRILSRKKHFEQTLTAEKDKTLFTLFSTQEIMAVTPLYDLPWFR